MIEANTTDPSAESKPVVVVHFDADGFISYLNTADTLLLIIDERAPEDRVYFYGHNSTLAEIVALVGESRIGHGGDGYLSDAEVQSIRALLWKRDGGNLSVIDGGQS